MKRRSRGEGSIFFNDTKSLWVAKITIPGSKPRTKYSKTQKVVRDWLTDQRNQLRQGLLVRDDSVTVGELIANYMENVAAHNLRPKSLEASSSLIKTHIVPVLGKIKLSQLGPDHLQTLYSTIYKKGLSKRTAQYVHSIMHKVLKQANIWGLVNRNVADLVTAPNPGKRNHKVYSKSEVDTFLASSASDRFYAAYVLAIYGGLREGEVLGLSVEDCDLEHRTVHISRAVQYQIGIGVVITDLKSDSSKRPVKLPQVAMLTLEKYLKHLNKNQGLLFTTASGKPINPRFLVLHFKDAIVKAGLPDIRFHDLRHTSATLLLKANVHPKVVQERLGHSSIVLTMDTYSHVIPGMQDTAADELDKMFSPP